MKSFLPSSMLGLIFSKTRYGGYQFVQQPPASTRLLVGSKTVKHWLILNWNHMQYGLGGILWSYGIYITIGINFLCLECLLGEHRWQHRECLRLYGVYSEPFFNVISWHCPSGSSRVSSAMVALLLTLGYINKTDF